MSKFRIELNQAKCQAYGRCSLVAPAFFGIGEDRKVRLLGSNESAEDVVMKAAKSCPYRVITIFDAESGEQLFPKRRSLELS
jgi:ferredoxin